MTESAPVPAHEQVGHRFAEWQTMVDDARQARYLSLIHI